MVAIGNALGLAAGTPTVTQGIVSALGRSVTAGGEGTQTETLQNMIQTDAAINPGNSGGPLIDTSGQVIGMNTAVAGTSSDGTSSQNIGFAIPTASVEALIPELQKGGQSGNGGGYLGVDITTLTPALRQQYGFTPTSGAVILTVVSGSPADKAGLVQGDVIVNIGGTAINSADDLQKVIQASKPGQSVTITYYVGDSKRTTTATLGSQAQAQQQTGSTTNPFGGGGFPGFGNSGSTGDTGRRPSQPPAPGGMSKFRSGWAGGYVHRPVGLPAAGLDVLEHVGHVVGVLLVGELAVARIDEARVARLPIRRTVGFRARHDLRPLHHHVVALDGRELNGKLPILQAQHGVDQPPRDRVAPFEASPGTVDVHRVLGVEVGQHPEGIRFDPFVDAPAQLVVAVHGRLDLVAWKRHRAPSLLRLAGAVCVPA